MAQANPSWGAPRIHGKLLKLGIDVCQTTVAKYMGHRPASFADLAHVLAESHWPDRGGRFLVVPTAIYRLLFALVLLARDTA
jgi:hypothetical protein